MQDTLWVVGTFGVFSHLGTQGAVGMGMRRVAVHFDGHATLHVGQQRAGVGAVVRARTAHVGCVAGDRLC